MNVVAPSAMRGKATPTGVSRCPIGCMRDALAMTLNELGTNTTKFGALSMPSGKVTIAWKIDSGIQRLNLTWTENGGPAVHAPTRRSFGTRMIEALGRQLNGQVHLAYQKQGFVYTLDVPLKALTDKP